MSGEAALKGREHKTCPDCAEQVQEAAHVCRYCGYRFDTGTGTEQRAPIGRFSQANAVPLAIALLGAFLAGIATFLPRIEAQEFARVAENTLIQSGDGIIILVLALAGAVAAYTGRDRPRRTWIAVVAGALIVALAIYDGTGDRLHLTGAATDSPDLFEALDAIAGERGSPGVGIWAAGIGGALLALGGFVLGRGARRQLAPSA